MPGVNDFGAFNGTSVTVAAGCEIFLMTGVRLNF